MTQLHAACFNHIYISQVSFALLVVITSNVWFYIDNYIGSVSNYRYGFYTFVKMMANAVVLCVEMRIRTNEVKSGLDVIESRRAFVRFVSHEVTTTKPNHNPTNLNSILILHISPTIYYFNTHPTLNSLLP